MTWRCYKMTLQNEEDEEESIKKLSELIPQLPPGMSIIERNHPAFPHGLVANDNIGEYYAIKNNKWEVVDYNV